MKIVSLVMNAATRDVRVVKAARSLTDAGHKVLIVGIQDGNHKSSAALLDGNLEVRRVDWRAPVYQRLAAKYARVAAVMAFIGLLFLVMLLWWARGLFSGAIGLVEGFWAFNPAVLSAETGGALSSIGGLAIVGLKALILLAILAALVMLGLWVIRRVIGFVRSAVVERVAGFVTMAHAVPGGDPKKPVRRPLLALFSGRPKQAFAELLSIVNERAFAGAVRDSRVDGMVELAEGFEADIIHCHEVHALPAAAKLKNKSGAKIVYDAHELYEELAQASPAVLEQHRCAHEQYLPVVDGMITVNDSIATAYKKSYPFLADPVVVKNATYYAELPDYDGRLHEAANLDASQKILLYQGGFAAKRGLEELVRAARLLPSDWSLVMMGWGRHEETLREIAAEGVHEWIAEVMDERQQTVMRELPADVREEIGKRVADNVVGEGPTSLKPQAREAGKSNLLGRFAQGASNDPFSYEDDPAVAAYSKTLATLVRLRLNEMNIDKPLLEDDYSKIRFVPPAPQDELQQWTQGATVGVIPYENDGLNHWFCSPNKLWEYPNAGVPILASGFPELHKVVIGDGVGWVLPPDPKAADIARCVERLSEDEIAQKKDACREYIERDNWAVYEKRLVSLFDWVGDGRNASKAGVE